AALEPVRDRSDGPAVQREGRYYPGTVRGRETGNRNGARTNAQHQRRVGCPGVAVVGTGQSVLLREDGAVRREVIDQVRLRLHPKEGVGGALGHVGSADEPGDHLNPVAAGHRAATGQVRAAFGHRCPSNLSSPSAAASSADGWVWKPATPSARTASAIASARCPNRSDRISV